MKGAHNLLAHVYKCVLARVGGHLGGEEGAESLEKASGAESAQRAGGQQAE